MLAKSSLYTLIKSFVTSAVLKDVPLPTTVVLPDDIVTVTVLPEFVAVTPSPTTLDSHHQF